LDTGRHFNCPGSFAADAFDFRGKGTLTGGPLLPYIFFSNRPASVDVSKALNAHKVVDLLVGGVNARLNIYFACKCKP
jgi:hypothetical protein